MVASAAHGVTLEEAFREAVRKNETVSQSRNKITQADEKLSQLKGNIYPRIDFKASYLLQPELNDPIARAIFPNQQTEVNFSLTQPLFRGLREFAALSMQKNIVAAQRDVYRSGLLKLYQQIAQSYFNILTYEQDLKNLRQQADIYGRRVGELQGRVRRGESSASEALTAQSAEAALLADIQTTTSLLATERENFAMLTGLDPAADLRDPDLVSQGPKKLKLGKLDDYLSGVDSRPDVIESKLRYEASDDEVRINRGAHFPTIDLTGNYYLVRPPGFLNEINWDVRINLVFPIWEGGGTQAKVREAVSRRKDAELEYQRARRQATQEIRAVYRSLQTRLEALDVLGRSVDFANRNAETLQRDYRRGLARNIDVQIALADYRVARRAMDQAHFGSQYDWIRLQAASSRLDLPAGTAGEE